MSQPSILNAMKRGVRGRCPNCGDGRLFYAYLKVESLCTACGHDNGHYRADDGPAYFTIFLIGHLIIGPVLFIPAIWSMNPFVLAATSLPVLAVTAVLMLPVVKGAVIGLLWALEARSPQA